MQTKRLLTCAAPLFGVVALLLTVCQDAGLGPERPQSVEYRPNALLSGTGGDTAVTTFTVAPDASGTYKIAGGHEIEFPAGSICDPATSSYGTGEWDNTSRRATQNAPGGAPT